MFAVLNINKPKGLTSHDVVARVRKVFNLKKVGHMGTLDPMAQGVLPVCLGQATRLIEYFPTGKCYTAEFKLGIETDTLDAEGEVTKQVGCPPITEAHIVQVLSTFEGEITQQVPLYSATKVGGKKLYQWARSQKKSALASGEIDLPTKTVTIHHITLRHMDTTDAAHPTITIDVACSSGTYIRSLGRDIGQQLDCGAHMTSLVRTEHGQFQLAQAVDLDTLSTDDNPAQYLLSPVAYIGMTQYPLLSDEQAQALQHGMKVSPEDNLPKTNQLYLAMFQQQPVGVVMGDAKQLKPVKIFAAL